MGHANNSGFVGPLDVQPDRGAAIDGCPPDVEVWFSVTIQYDVMPDDNEPGITFGTCDYTQQPTAFPLTDHGFKTVSADAIKLPTNTQSCVVSFFGQIPEGSRFGIYNDTNRACRVYVRWSTRKVAV